jgi:hypothetical protein
MNYSTRVLYWILPLVLSSFIWGWGYDVHRRINFKAAQIMEGNLGLYTKSHADELALFAPVADFIKPAHRGEFHRHFIDADYYTSFPFDDLNISYDELVSRFGDDNIKQWGMAPWSIDETANILVKMIKSDRWDEALYFMGHIGHYVADLHMPLHTCANYNGQLTGNDGVHFRWESRMVDELISEIIPVGNIHKIDNYIDAAFKITRDSFSVYPRLLRADSIARKHLTPEQAYELNTYKVLNFENRYLELLYAETEDVVHDRLGQAAVSVASYWYSCWLAAGSPTPPK